MKRFYVSQKRDYRFINRVMDFMFKVYTWDEDYNVVAVSLTKKV